MVEANPTITNRADISVQKDVGFPYDVIADVKWQILIPDGEMAI